MKWRGDLSVHTHASIMPPVTNLRGFICLLRRTIISVSDTAKEAAFDLGDTCGCDRDHRLREAAMIIKA